MNIIPKIWRDQPGRFFVFCTRPKGQKEGFKEHWIPKDEIEYTRSRYERYMDTHDMWFCPHGFKSKKRSRSTAEPGNYLYADLDKIDPDELPVRPTILIRSSPGRYVGLWKCDDEISDELNRRITYASGADKSGWDYGQVLRLAEGTINYKYNSEPQVRTIWTDGPSYRIPQITKMLPSRDTSEKLSVSVILAKYKRRLRPWVVQELMHGRPEEGKRSDVLWKLETTLLESGVSEEEAFTLLLNSPWNKFKSRRDGAEQLRKELAKARDQKRDEPLDSDNLLNQSLDSVTAEDPDWIWYPFFAVGELTMIEGDPGIGKSYLINMIAKGIVDREKLPQDGHNSYRQKSGKVLYFDIENRMEQTKARLEDMGVQNFKDIIIHDKPFSIGEGADWGALCDAIVRVKPRLIIFDTINTYMGQADTHKGSDVQTRLADLIDLAREVGAGIASLRHLTKGNVGAKALYRGTGSISFSGMARVVITVADHPEDDGLKVMANTKNNLTQRARSLTYEIHTLKPTLKRKNRSTAEWLDWIDLTADDILTPSPDKKKGEMLQDAVAFIKQFLEDGPVERQKVMRAADARGFTENLIARAAKKLGVESTTSGFGSGRKALWDLPDQS